jgi:hypothetical protein
MWHSFELHQFVSQSVFLLCSQPVKLKRVSDPVFLRATIFLGATEIKKKCVRWKDDLPVFPESAPARRGAWSYRDNSATSSRNTSSWSSTWAQDRFPIKSSPSADICEKTEKRLVNKIQKKSGLIWWVCWLVSCVFNKSVCESASCERTRAISYISSPRAAWAKNNC